MCAGMCSAWLDCGATLAYSRAASRPRWAWAGIVVGVEQVVQGAGMPRVRGQHAGQNLGRLALCSGLPASDGLCSSWLPAVPARLRVVVPSRASA